MLRVAFIAAADGLFLSLCADDNASKPQIIFTADITLDAQRKAERLGVRGYINKPLDFADLLVRVARVFMPKA